MLKPEQPVFKKLPRAFSIFCVAYRLKSLIRRRLAGVDMVQLDSQDVNIRYRRCYFESGSILLVQRTSVSSIRFNIDVSRSLAWILLLPVFSTKTVSLGLDQTNTKWGTSNCSMI